MKGQMKLLAAATMLAAGSANAAIDLSTTGNGELFFSIWDKTAKVAYTKDLGIQMNDFLIGTAAATNDQTFSMAGDSNWTDFLANADMSSSVWMVGAMDSSGSASAGGSRYLSTSNNAITTLKNQNNLATNDMKATNSFLLAVNPKDTHATQANGSSYTTLADDGNAYSGGTYNLETWTTKAQGWLSTATPGDSLNFFFMTTSSTNGGGKQTVGQFMENNGIEGATWSLNLATNELDYNVVTPIPAAAWLLGSALLGLVGVGRRQTKSNVVAA